MHQAQYGKESILETKTGEEPANEQNDDKEKKGFYKMHEMDATIIYNPI